MWDHADSAKVIKLDLKQTNHEFLHQIVDFLGPRAGCAEVMISTRDTDAIEYLHARLPEVTMLYSVAWPDARQHVQSDPSWSRPSAG